VATRPFDPAPLRQAVADIGRLKHEALDVFTTRVLPTWEDPAWSGYNQTLYGYMQRIFAFVDLLSCYWRYPAPRSDQTLRMVDFLEQYMGYSREALSAAVQIWRHTLAHTARPRALIDPATGGTIYWLLQWYEPHISRAQHFTWSDSAGQRNLNLGMIHLIEDLERAAAAFVADVASSPARQAEMARYEAKLQSYRFKSV
jgi:hypothetical protein